MDILATLKEIKRLVFSAQQAAAAPAGTEYKLQDGTPVTISTLAAGGDAFVNGAPAKAGDYILENGSKFTVGSDGKISAVEIKQAAADPAPIVSSLTNGSQVTITIAAIGGIMKGADGNPLAAGSYTLADGTLVTVDATGTITAYTPAVTNDMNDFVAALKKGTATADQFAKVFQQFDTPGADQMIGLKIIVKALFESVFGWQIRQAQEQAGVQAALDAYKTGFAKMQGQFNSLLEANGHMYDVVEAFAKKPSGKRPGAEIDPAGSHTGSGSDVNSFAGAFQKIQQEKKK